MLKVWNMVLVILTFALTIFGTFLTRSGVISSVHSFTQSGLGPFFLVFLGVILVVSVGLLLWRLPLLKSRSELESVFSREALQIQLAGTFPLLNPRGNEFDQSRHQVLLAPA